MRLLLILMLVSALAELQAIAAVIPFLSALTGTGMEGLDLARTLFEWLGTTSPREQLLAATWIFASAAILAGVLRTALAWMTQSFSFGLGHDLAVEIQTRLLYQPYAFHTASSTAILLAAHEKVYDFVHGTLLPALNGLIAAVTCLFIIAVLTCIEPVAAGVALAAVAGVYVAISLITRERLRRYGAIISSTHSERIRSVQESLGGIRDVILDRSQPLHLAQFDRISRDYSRHEMKAAFVSSVPRYAIEAAGMVLIAIFAVALSGEGGFASALPILGAMALSALRLLPLLQQVYHGWAKLRTGGASADELASLLDLPSPVPAQVNAEPYPLPFEHEIRFVNLGFTYPDRRDPALKDISFAIPRGSRVALVGPTGSGKSTLLDILMGLLDATEGSLTVDGISPGGSNRTGWQSQIAHVPQTVFLADTSIARNIAFGEAEETIDHDRIRWAARLAKANEFIEALPGRYETATGERGIRLSGGQRQRIGIARALYKRAPVLILDEATSALDLEVEAAVMNNLLSLGDEVTIVMVAHRLPSVARCDMIVGLDAGSIRKIDRPADQNEFARIFG